MREAMKLQELDISGPAGRLAGWSAGENASDKPAVLLIHPINTQGRIWADLIDLLDPQGRYVMPDLRAHGGSDASGEFSLAEWTADCLAVIEQELPSGPFHVVGGSLGGPLACCVAAALPERVSSVTAIGSSLNFDGVEVSGVLDMFDRLGVAGTFRTVFPTMTFGPGSSQDVIDKALALANPNDVATVKRVWSATIASDATEQASQLDCPALVINGEHDTTCTPALGLELARVLRTEQVIMPDIGHMPMLECPERVALLLTQQVNRAGSP
ncbi:alpha/beta fold hydrolase [Prauserella halophila]|uniref:Alpha/beta fold hydrolase n=1 Tax=Prauserella halophila TaxID=185641 RepID=A0ABN1WAZ0_9PSEU|nr:alpha/beta hydrolase [Prauserella halophila]MCP2234907.1 Pimeloyl-ACP methyl ester carboxylesterase [Prauserella halophila]